MWKGKQCHLKAPAVVSQSRTHSRDSDASHAPAEDGLLGYTTAQLQKGRNKETPPCSSTTAKHRQHTDNKLKREQACRTLGLKEERYVMRVPGASFATSIPGQQLEEPQSECQQLQVNRQGPREKLSSFGKTIKNGKPEKQNNHTTAAKDHHENVYLPRIPNFPVTPNLAYNLNLHNSTPRHCVRTEAPRYPRTAEAKVPWQIALIHT